MSNSVNLSLDVTKTGIQNPLIKVRQGDGGFETLRITVTANGEPMDLQGWTITFMGTTAGNHKIVDGNVTLVEAPNGIFDYTPSKAWGMDIGDFKIAYFKFVKGDGSASSANFRVNVIEAVDLTQEEAQNYISVVDTTIAEINQHLTDSLANVTQSIADANANANTVASNVNSLGNRVDDYNNKLAAVQVGARNYILNSKRSLAGSGSSSDTGWVNTSIPVKSFSNKRIVVSVQVDYDNITSISASNRIGFEASANQSNQDGSTVNRFFGTWRTVSVGDSFHGRIYSTFYPSNVNLESLDTSKPNAWGGGMYIQGVTGTNVSVSNPKIEIGNVATDWMPAPEDAPSNEAQLVHKTGTETITGDKTFTGNVNFSGKVGLDEYVKKTNVLPAEARDFNYLATHMKTYQGYWYNRSESIANAPTANWIWSIVEIVAGNSETNGLIRTMRVGSDAVYSASVNSGVVNRWTLIADDAQLVHKTGNESIGDYKTFTGKVTADNLVSNSVPVNITKTTTSKMWYSSTLTAYRTGNTVTIVNNKQDTSVIADNTASTETIPAGYRPATVLFYPVVYGSSLKGELQINTDGTFTARGAINGQYRLTATYVTGDAWPV